MIISLCRTLGITHHHDLLGKLSTAPIIFVTLLKTTPIKCAPSPSLVEIAGQVGRIAGETGGITKGGSTASNAAREANALSNGFSKTSTVTHAGSDLFHPGKTPPLSELFTTICIRDHQ